MPQITAKWDPTYVPTYIPTCLRTLCSYACHVELSKLFEAGLRKKSIIAGGKIANSVAQYMYIHRISK